MQKLRVGDQVTVIAGKDKGKTGKVSKINKKKRKVVVSGLNMVKKMIRPTQENPKGGSIKIEHPLDISNVAVLSPKTKKASRVRIETRDGKKVRVAVACGSPLVSTGVRSGKV